MPKPHRITRDEIDALTAGAYGAADDARNYADSVQKGHVEEGAGDFRVISDLLYLSRAFADLAAQLSYRCRIEEVFRRDTVV